MSESLTGSYGGNDFIGTYVNPGNISFVQINDLDYVDKSHLIELINQTIRKKKTGAKVRD